MTDAEGHGEGAVGQLVRFSGAVADLDRLEQGRDRGGCGDRFLEAYLAEVYRVENERLAGAQIGRQQIQVLTRLGTKIRVAFGHAEVRGDFLDIFLDAVRQKQTAEWHLLNRHRQP